MRLNRYLSTCGLGSRRGCEALILEGRVTVNGAICNQLATVVSDADEITADGVKVKPNKPVVIALHKPKGFVCSRRDEHDRETLYALLPEKFATLHHVGRLDKDSEGLILLTNQGELSQRLLHPSKGVEKEYEVVIEERFDPANLEKLIKGFVTEEGRAKAERAWMIGDYRIGLVLKQGFKRQIRNMLYFLGYEVRRLIRVRIGNLSIKGLREGAWKELSDDDVEKLLLNPQSKDRPKLSKPRTASVKRHATKRASAKGNGAGASGARGKAGDETRPSTSKKTGSRGERSRPPQGRNDEDSSPKRRSFEGRSGSTSSRGDGTTRSYGAGRRSDGPSRGRGGSISGGGGRSTGAGDQSGRSRRPRSGDGGRGRSSRS